jgi:hypothetical protein
MTNITTVLIVLLVVALPTILVHSNPHPTPVNRQPAQDTCQSLNYQAMTTMKQREFDRLCGKPHLRRPDGVIQL